MINLYRDPHGEKAFDKSNPTKAAGGNQNSKSVPSLNTNAVEGGYLIPLLQNQIREQKEAIQARERRINELEEILNASKVHFTYLSNVYIATECIYRLYMHTAEHSPIHGYDTIHPKYKDLAIDNNKFY